MKNNILNINIPQQPTAKLKVLPVYKNKIAIAQGAGLVIIQVTDILYCQAQSSYCKIILKTGKEYLISKTLKRVQAVLDPMEFISVHQSYLVAIDAIIALDEKLTLVNKRIIPVSRSRRKNLVANIKKHCMVV